MSRKRSITVGLALLAVVALVSGALDVSVYRSEPAPGPPGRTFRIAPAPAGDPAEVALPIIRERQPGICPAIHQAVRIFDGTIRAVCDDGHVIRIFTLQETGHTVALRCVPPADGSPSVC